MEQFDANRTLRVESVSAEMRTRGSDAWEEGENSCPWLPRAGLVHKSESPGLVCLLRGGTAIDSGDGD